MEQEIGRRSVTVEALIRFQISPCEIFGGQSCSGSDFYPNASVFRYQYRSTKVPCSSSTCRYYEGEKRVKSRSFQIALLTQKLERWIVKRVDFFGP